MLMREQWSSAAMRCTAAIEIAVLHFVTTRYHRRTHSGRRRTVGTGARWILCFILFSQAWGPFSPANSAAFGLTEYQVKAAYLFNFLKFVEWPAEKAGDLQARWVIGVVGDNPVGNVLMQLVAGKNVLGRELEIKKLQPEENMRGCNILFISASERSRLPSILGGLRGSNVLTVADMDHFIESGGMIQFVMEDGSVRFSIDVGATAQAKLKVSSKLLSIARVVNPPEKGISN